MGRNYKWLEENVLTPRQVKLFNFLKKYKNDYNYMPSFKEMKEYMGVKSKNSIHQMIGHLEFKGYIKRLPYRARALEIIKEYR
jgi:repressor LexA